MWILSISGHGKKCYLGYEKNVGVRKESRPILCEKSKCTQFNTRKDAVDATCHFLFEPGKLKIEHVTT